ncbi:kinase-like domain-containing protein [Pisolithus croceorrhizus]|nr:kinase-like domain-containing protein [Pisolithus croceorrhizus]KAI6131335.1 kinase-like domain-containing protein [Pisolithus croceorrhizus]
MHVRSKLHHANVVRMPGISTEFDSTISIISEWMPLGNARTYVKTAENDPRPLASRGAFTFALLNILELGDIASGLYYLHSHELGVVHGNLKGFNLMVSSNRRALRTDFGHAATNIPTFNTTVEINCGYSSSAAPELLENYPASTASVWAFGMTTLELFTRTIPFPDRRGPVQVIAMLTKRKLPPRPALESTRFRVTDSWREICLPCWESDPPSRPTMKDIMEKVEASIVCTGQFYQVLVF